MGRPAMTALSLLILCAGGCAAWFPVEGRPGSKKVVVDAEWSTDHPTQEMLAAVRDSKTDELPPQVQQSLGGSSQPTSQQPHVSPAKPAAARATVSQRRPGTSMASPGTSVASPGTSVARPRASGDGRDESKLPGQPPSPTPIADALGRATRRDTLATRSEALERAAEPDALEDTAEKKAPQRTTSATAPEDTSRANDASRPGEGAAKPRSQPERPATPPPGPLKAQDLRLKAIARDARGEAVAQLALPSGSVLFVRRGERLQLPTADSPADVHIEQIEDTQVQFRFNGSPQVLTLR